MEAAYDISLGIRNRVINRGEHGNLGSEVKNGIKLKAAYGGSASAAVAKAVEEQISANQTTGARPKKIEV